MNPTAQYGINKDYITQAENFADRVSNYKQFWTEKEGFYIKFEPL